MMKWYSPSTKLPEATWSIAWSSSAIWLTALSPEEIIMPFVRSSTLNASCRPIGLNECVMTYSKSRYFSPLRMPGQVPSVYSLMLRMAPKWFFPPGVLITKSPVLAENMCRLTGR